MADSDHYDHAAQLLAHIAATWPNPFPEVLAAMAQAHALLAVADALKNHASK